MTTSRRAPETFGATDAVLLGAPECYTRGQATAAAGVDPALVRRFWRALGFASAAEDSVAFTEADVAALGRLGALGEELGLDEEETVRLVRAIGQTTARLAEWVTAEFQEWDHGRQGRQDGDDGRQGEDDGRQDGDDGRQDGQDRPGEQPIAPWVASDAVLAASLRHLDEMIVYGFRRQLAASVARLRETDGAEHRTQMAVGFADLVSFTRLSRRLRAGELAALVDTFESVASDVVAASRGRLVKTLGDEVFFIAEEPAALATIALTLIERLGAHPDVPAVRVGLAYGEVLPRMGDVFGTTVNLASRLTALSSGDVVVVDRAFADAVAEHPDFRLTGMRRRQVRGLGRVDASRLRRAR